MGYDWNEYRTMFIANGMCGLPFTIAEVAGATTDEETVDTANPVTVSMTKNGGGEDLLSVTYWINNSTNSYPVICAYAGRDSVVGVYQYANLATALDARSIEHPFFYFENSNHQDIDNKDPSRVDVYNAFLAEVTSRCNALL